MKKIQYFSGQKNIHVAECGFPHIDYYDPYVKTHKGEIDIKNGEWIIILKNGHKYIISSEADLNEIGLISAGINTNVGKTKIS